MMRWLAIPLFLAAAGSCSCGNSHVLPDASPMMDAPEVPCERVNWFDAEWIVDGMMGASRCTQTDASLRVSATPPVLEAMMGFGSGASGDGFPRPLCLLRMDFYNVPFETGRTGVVDDPSLGPGPDGTDARVVATLTLPRSGGCDGGEYVTARVVGGTYHVVAGAGVGEIVELELRDLRFEPHEGHEIELLRVRGRAQVSREPRSIE